MCEVSTSPMSHKSLLLKNINSIQRPTCTLFKMLVRVFLFLLLSNRVLSFGITRQNLQRPTKSALYSVPDPFDTLTSGFASIFRLNRGVVVTDELVSPSEFQPVLKKLYDIENDSDCRRVREKITEFDLCVEKVIPSTPQSRARTDATYPYRVGENEIPKLVVTEVSGSERILTGSSEIIAFLDEKFLAPLPGKVPDALEKVKQLEILDRIGGALADLLRTGRGKERSPSASVAAPRPEKPLILYDYCGNQFSRLVREVLTELDIVWELRSAGKGSPRREELSDITGGATQCPYLVDPNTGVSMAESADIILYLYKTYALWTPPNELLRWASDNILPLLKPVFTFLARVQAGSQNEDASAYEQSIDSARAEIEKEIRSAPVVIYTYAWSPFSSEAKALLDNLQIQYKEISLGSEWVPGLISPGGAEKRVAMLDMSGQSSLPQVFIGGGAIGGLFSGSPGLLPALEQGILLQRVEEANSATMSK